MLQSMHGCWQRLSSLGLHFKPVSRQPLHHEPAAPGLPGDISISKNKLKFVCKYLSNIFLPSWHYISPLAYTSRLPGSQLPLQQHCHLPSPGCPGTASCPHLAVPAGAAALGHTLDLPGQGLVHQVGQGLLSEQVGPQLHTGRVFQQGKGQQRNRKSCSAIISRNHNPPLALLRAPHPPAQGV